MGSVGGVGGKIVTSQYPVPSPQSPVPSPQSPVPTPFFTETNAEFSNCHRCEYIAGGHGDDWGDLAKTQFGWE